MTASTHGKDLIHHRFCVTKSNESNCVDTQFNKDDGVLVDFAYNCENLPPETLGLSKFKLSSPKEKRIDALTLTITVRFYPTN